MTTSATTIDEQLAGYVRNRVQLLQSQYARGGQQPTSWAAGTMAALRRADPASPGDDPALWEVVFDQLPAALANPGADEPSRAEAAVHAALCLYAVHQQSRNEPMHVPQVRFGQAVRSLARLRARDREQLSPGVIRRMHMAGTATTQARRLAEIRGLLTMMRSATPRVAFDYGLLARDLYWLADPRSAPGVRLSWGRDLRRLLPHSGPAGADSAPDPASTTVPAV